MANIYFNIIGFIVGASVIVYGGTKLILDHCKDIHSIHNYLFLR